MYNSIKLNNQSSLNIKERRYATNKLSHTHTDKPQYLFEVKYLNKVITCLEKLFIIGEI